MFVCPKCQAENECGAYFDDCLNCGWSKSSRYINPEDRERINQAAKEWGKNRKIAATGPEGFREGARMELIGYKADKEKLVKENDVFRKKVKVDKQWEKVLDDLNGAFQREIAEKNEEIVKLKELVEWYRIGGKF